MKIKYYIIPLLFSALISQQIGTDWIDVRGKSSQEIKKVISTEIKQIKTYTKDIIEQEEEKLANENEDKKYDYNSRKIDLRSNLNGASANKQIAEINFIKAKDISNETHSLLKAQLQIISDSDSSIASNQKVIDEKKEEVEEELTKLPFQVVIVSINYGYDGSNVKAIDAAMEYQIAKKAIESELGFKVVSASIINNGILSEQRVKILLSGKVNFRLESEDIPLEQADGSLLFDRIRYGLTTVYPFETDNNLILNKPISSSKYNIETYISKTDEAKKIANNIDRFREIRSLNQSANSKNIESESVIKRIGAEAKNFIEDRQKEIKKGLINKNSAQMQIDEYYTQITGLSADSLSKAIELKSTTGEFNKVKNKYTTHIYSENYIFSETRFTDRVENVNMNEQYISSAESLYDLFMANVNSQIVKEVSEIKDDQFSEFSGTKKDKVSINSVRILGKIFIDKRKSSTGKPNLGVSLAFDYGFTFKESPIGKNNYMADTDLDNELLKKYPGPKSYNEHNIKFISNPSGAQVYLSGRKIGTTPFLFNIDSDGPNGIVVKKDGYQDKVDVVSVKNGTNITQNYNLKKIKNKSASRKLIIYGILGGGIVYAVSKINKDKEKGAGTGSMSVKIIIPN